MDLHYSQTCSAVDTDGCSFTTLWIYTILKPVNQGGARYTSFTTLWIYTILKQRCGHKYSSNRFTTLWIYTILKLTQHHRMRPLRFTTLWIYTILKLIVEHFPDCLVSLPYGFTLFSNGKYVFNIRVTVSLPYGFTLFSNKSAPVFQERFVSLPYGFTLFSNPKNFTCSHRQFHYLMDLHYSQTFIRLIKQPSGFTTLWIYTILKPQISYAHYTAQGKSTRSSTIVLWQNGIVKGAQIPIQHIEFGAHIYARRCLAL